jgi:hypothetical protein
LELLAALQAICIHCFSMYALSPVIYQHQMHSSIRSCKITSMIKKERGLGLISPYYGCEFRSGNTSLRWTAKSMMPKADG